VGNVFHKEDVVRRSPAQFIPETADLILNDIAHLHAGIVPGPWKAVHNSAISHTAHAHSTLNPDNKEGHERVKERLLLPISVGKHQIQTSVALSDLKLVPSLARTRAAHSRGRRSGRDGDDGAARSFQRSRVAVMCAGSRLINSDS